MTRPDIGREDEALEVCKGIVLGLCRAVRLHFEVLEYAKDCPSELTSRAAELWHTGRRTACLEHDFVEKHAPDWNWD